ncbi:hypothetical protein FEZ48_02270 [Marinilactibacillus psychrotolerans]|uniref:N-acylglucosamine-6-phosphate 2-epimerase n=1 Tax=Marinilactibacillus psychrotolerans TaxID=191770 RepID=A0A5R9C762_9LACT|nr:hypothetical protein [Marinilactibacillus psychrotolerans]TLQ08998.1 hypothetical protein FEZ48_02270 [Marinilactibacillus psychrotolerans]
MKKSLIDMLNTNKLSLIVSLPSNDIELAREAVQNGADAIKVHINVSHRASGNDFGSVEENKEFLKQLVDEFDCPIGIVPSDSHEKIMKEEIEFLESIGFSYFSIYMQDCPTFLLNSKLEKTVAGNYDYQLEEIKHIDQVGVQAFEASIIHGDEYGTPINVSDLLKYTSIVENVNVPVIVPTQRKVIPEDVRALYKTGVKAIMAGAVSIGTEKESIGRTVKEFRKAFDEIITEEA